MSKWKMPPRIKVYEALGALADGRVRAVGNSATVVSSSGHKSYEVEFDPKARAIASNDNASYWQGYLGYPAIALLMQLGELPFDPDVAGWLKDIAWKEVNNRFRNDYTKTESHVRETIKSGQSVDLTELDKHIDKVIEELSRLSLERPTTRSRPPVE